MPDCGGQQGGRPWLCRVAGNHKPVQLLLLLLLVLLLLLWLLLVVLVQGLLLRLLKGILSDHSRSD